MNENLELKTDVLAELAWEPSMTSDRIGVTAADGVVTLSGHVSSYWQKAIAERAVSRVKGVRAIVEEIEVLLPDSCNHSDDEIDTAARLRLSWDASIPRDAVKIDVQAGYVSLTGEVDWHYQYDEVFRTIGTLPGVTGVSNLITVKRLTDTSQIEADIRDALHRSWLSNERMKVTAESGEVHLTGSVDNWRDRKMAAMIAWRASGTTSVVNELWVD